MGRNSRHRQQHQQQGSNGNELLNFHFSTPASSLHDASTSGNNSRNRGGNHARSKRNHKNKTNCRRSAQDRASVRQKADSSMFYLHSSAEHSFLLSRRSPSKLKTNEYSFHGSDQSVSWDSVRIVHQRMQMNDDNEVCPICLCDFVCARISKCGHSFCLSCILRHVQTSATTNPYQPVRCPCCGVPIIVEDMRPVVMEVVRPVVLQQNFRLRKLHRQKGSSAPFLPIPGAPQHANPHFAPTTGVDPDAKYSRFNYLDPDAYHALLVANQGELQRELKTTIGEASVERMYLSLALEIVLTEQQKAIQESGEEKELMMRFACSNTGMYQPQSPALEFREESESNVTLEIDASPSAQENETNYDNEIPDLKIELSPVQNRVHSMESNKSVVSESAQCSNKHGCGVETKSASGKARNSRRKPRKKFHGSMYLDTATSVHLYQADDGQLVFLNGFNMTCLLNDFSKSPPSDETSTDVSNRVPAGPLPDFLEGRVLEKENIHLTSEIRKRMPFLNHIPLYTDISFVELDLNHVLSEETRRKFKNEITKRRKKRQSKTQAEKRADLLAKKEDQDRINARKARLQLVDPNDEFFHTSVITPISSDNAPESNELGPVPGGDAALSSGIMNEVQNSGHTASHPPVLSSSTFSFSQAAQRANAIEVLPISSSEAFPTLGSQPLPAPTSRGGSSTWRSEPLSAKFATSATISEGTNITPRRKTGKKKKSQKIVLFSTGGARGN